MKNTENKVEIMPNSKDVAENNQLFGMKELFSTILQENRKDYDNQLGEMKKLFVDVLEENRKAFSSQLQSLTSALPTMIGNSSGAGVSREREEVIFLGGNQNHSGEQVPSLEKYRKLDAISAIILGQDVEELNIQIKSVHNAINDFHVNGNTEINGLIKEMESLLNEKIGNMNNQISNLINSLSLAMKNNDDAMSSRSAASELFLQTAQKAK